MRGHVKAESMAFIIVPHSHSAVSGGLSTLRVKQKSMHSGALGRSACALREKLLFPCHAARPAGNSSPMLHVAFLLEAEIWSTLQHYCTVYPINYI